MAEMYPLKYSTCDGVKRPPKDLTKHILADVLGLATVSPRRTRMCQWICDSSVKMTIWEEM